MDRGFLRSPGPIRTKPGLEKGLKLVTSLYGPVPPLYSPQTTEIRTIPAVIPAKPIQEVTKTKEFRSSTLLDLQNFEKISKKRLRCQSNRSLPSLQSAIKLKYTSAARRDSVN